MLLTYLSMSRMLSVVTVTFTSRADLERYNEFWLSVSAIFFILLVSMLVSTT